MKTISTYGKINFQEIMELDFINNGPEKYDCYEDIFCSLAHKVFDYLKIDTDYLIDVSIVDNKTIHKINKEYRNVDRPTDVISFAFFDDVNEKSLPGVPSSLGEIIISFEKAEEQAVQYDHSAKREFSFLFVHGMLHLLGYDHMNEEDEKEMFSLQEKILGERVTMENEKLVELAIDARKRSYSPYSHFAVGAALLTKSGKTYIGANIENSSYPLCMCAERNAIYGAYLDDVKKEEIVALAIAADTDGPCSPCGACRQVISELLPKNAKILMANLKNEIKETTTAELLPFAFSEDDLK